VLIVDDDGSFSFSFFSPPSLAFVFGTSASAGDPRAGARGAGCCTDTNKELELEPEALFLFDRFFFNFFLGVVTTAEKERGKTIHQ
jgi:hypothetical protein